MAFDHDALWDKLGKICNLFATYDYVRGGWDQGAPGGRLQDFVESVIDEYDGEEPELQALIGNFQATAIATGGRAFAQLFQQLKTSAQNTLIHLVNEEDQQPNNSFKTALTAYAAMMLDDSEDIETQAITLTTTYSTSGGSSNDFGLISTTKDGDGKEREYALAEDIVVSFSSTTSAKAKGEPAAGIMAADYPAGSGASLSLTVQTDGLLTDGGFEDWTGGDPDSWTEEVGSVTEESSTVHLGSKAVKIVGDGATLFQIKQSVSLEARTAYAFVIRSRVSATPAAGVLTIDLYDEDESAVLQDENGDNQSTTIDLTAASTSAWDDDSVVFRTPEPLPSSVSLRIHISTALSSGKNAFIDSCGLAKMTQAYRGGPLLALFKGDAAWSKDDTISLAVGNSKSALFAFWVARLFDLRKHGVILPSDASPTQADSKITL